MFDLIDNYIPKIDGRKFALHLGVTSWNKTDNENFAYARSIKEKSIFVSQ